MSIDARAHNLQQLADFIVANSKGNAVIVMGDTNARYTRKGDNVRTLLQGPQLQDAWIESVRKGDIPVEGAPAIHCRLEDMTNDCEVVDKIFFRRGRVVGLALKSFDIGDKHNTFVGPDGKPLSDHPPLHAVFEYSLSATMRTSDAFGGPHGDRFSDVDQVAEREVVTSISIQGSARVDAVELQASSGKVFRHGGSGGSKRTLALQPHEFLSKATICWDKPRGWVVDGRTRVYFLQLETSSGRTIENGKRTKQCADVVAPEGFQIAGFHGRAGNEVDQLGLVFTKRA